MLKPIDITVLAAIICHDTDDWVQSDIAQFLGVSQSNVSRAVAQLRRSRLLRDTTPNRAGFYELLVHAAKYTYPASIGAPARGIPTAHAGPAMAEQFPSQDPYVWAHEAGRAFGTALEPIHNSVPGASLKSSLFYNFMALVDAIRIGRVRERLASQKHLAAMLGVGPNETH